VIEEYDYTVHKMSHVEENMEGKNTGFRARRWVMEGTNLGE